jgi:hypothetical protein
LVEDPFNLESKGSVKANFLHHGVSGSFGGTRAHILMMSAMFVSDKLNAQCFNVKWIAPTAYLRVQWYWAGGN